MDYDKEELVKLYVGKNYNQFVSRGYSYWCLFFGWSYLFYRKYYKLAFILLMFHIFTAFLFLFVMEFPIYYVLLIGILIFQFILGISFKESYLLDAKEKVDKIVGSGIIGDDLKQKVINSGGVDNRAFYLIFVVGIIYCFLFVVSNMVLFRDLRIHFPEELKEILEQNPSIDTYVKNGYNYSEYNINYDNNGSKCTIYLKGNDEYTLKNMDGSLVEISQQYFKASYGMDANFEKIVLNDIPFTYFYDEINNVYYYIYISKDSFKSFSINIKDDKGGKCEEIRKYVVEHVEIS